MYCTFKLTIASMKMFLRNKQALFFSLFMPLFILCIFGLMSFDAPSKMNVGLVAHKPSAATAEFLDHVRSIPAFTINDGSLNSELSKLKSGDRTVVLDVPDNLIMPAAGDAAPQLKVYLNQSRPIEAGEAMSIISQLADKAALFMAHAQPAFEIQQQSVDVHKIRYVEFLLPGVIAMAVMQMSVFSVAYVFANYREKGVLKRLLATPMRPYQFVTANIVTRLTMSVAQAFIFIVLGMMLFHIHIAGAFWLVAILIVLGSLAFLGMGFAISGVSKSTETVPVLGNLVVFPMLFLGDVFFSASNMPTWLRPIADNLPLTYFAAALRAVMTNGDGPRQIQGDLAGISLWAIGLIALAIITFRMSEKEAA